MQHQQSTRGIERYAQKPLQSLPELMCLTKKCLVEDATCIRIGKQTNKLVFSWKRMVEKERELCNFFCEQSHPPHPLQNLRAENTSHC